METYPFVLSDASISIEGLWQDGSRRYNGESSLSEEVLECISAKYKTRLQGTYLNDLVYLLAVLLICCSHIAFLVIGSSIAIWIGV